MFEQYIHKGTQKLRMGFTTGSCATLAAKAAAQMLLSGEKLDASAIMTPKGIPVQAKLNDVQMFPGKVICAVEKFAGDDPDITDGIWIYAQVEKSSGETIQIEGGPGVGRVTRPGLDQPVGAAAINRVPRQMIEKEVRAVCQAFSYSGGLFITLSIPEGEERAKKTFNPTLGIKGGLSIIGTSGIVEPMSMQALLDTVEVEMKQHKAEGVRHLVATPGNYGEAFLQALPPLRHTPKVKCSNFIGDTLDFAVYLQFESLLFVGHIGKMIKLAGGIMNTHSKVADARLELLALHAALTGANRQTVAAIANCMTVDAGIEILQSLNINKKVMQSLGAKMQEYLNSRAKEQIKTGAVFFSNQHGLLGMTPGAKEILHQME